MTAAGRPLAIKDPLHQLHRDQVSLVGLGAGDHDLAVALGPAVRVEQAFGEIAGRKQLQQAELILPAQAVGLEFGQQVEHGQVAAKLLAGGFRREIVGVGLVPVEGDAAILHELEGVVDAIVGDRSVRSISQAWSTLCSVNPIG